MSGCVGRAVQIKNRKFDVYTFTVVRRYKDMYLHESINFSAINVSE